MVQFVHDSICYRFVEKKDVADIVDIYRPFIENSWVSFEITVPTNSQFWQRIQKITVVDPWIVAEFRGKILGYAYASEHRSREAYVWSREVSAYVGQDHRKRGLGRKLYLGLFEVLKLQHYTNLLAGITMPNPGSVSFHKKLGFQYVGTYHNIGYKMGRFRDVSWWEKFIGVQGMSPRIPISYHQLPGSEVKQAFRIGIGKD
jgi:phosphinothricin acetyltransferase